jgi:hypothetical protein
MTKAEIQREIAAIDGLISTLEERRYRLKDQLGDVSTTLTPKPENKNLSDTEVSELRSRRRRTAFQ